MKRFTKPLLIFLLLAVIFTAGLITILKPSAKKELPVKNTEVSEPAAVSERPLEKTQKTQAVDLAIDADNAAILSSSIRAAVLSNDTEATSLPQVTTDTIQPTAPNRPLALIDSPIAVKWLEEEGITRADIELAQSRLEDNGFSARMQEDPSLVRQYLPRRNIQAAHIRSFTIAEKAGAGVAIPFSIGGALPDSSFEFTHFDISQSSNVIRILPIGNSSGDTAPGEEVPVELNGELAPLAPGIYQIEFPELGPDGFYELIVE